MAHKDHQHCQNCGAHFETHAELERHCLAIHEQEIIAGVRSDCVPVAQGASTSRKNREFTRSHVE